MAAFASWIIASLVGPGEHGEYWDAWNLSIDLAWKVIPVALFVGIACAVIATSAPAQTGESSRARGGVALVLLVAFGVFVVLLLLNLRIG